MSRTRSLTRRDVLQRAGLVVAAAALPDRLAFAAAQEGAALAPGQTNADLPISAVMTRLSTYMAEERE